MSSLRYFSEKEFSCCCGNSFEKMDDNLLKMLDTARAVAGVPFKVTSSYRCAKKNESVGGVKNSAHTRGTAVDIACSTSSDRFIILDALLTAGFERIGIAKTFIHADVDQELPQGLTWLY